MTNVYPNNKKNNKVKSKPIELFELAGNFFWYFSRQHEVLGEKLSGIRRWSKSRYE
jgi:hypothetical protein